MSLLDAIDGAVRSSFCIAGSTLEGLTGLLQVVGSSPNDGLEESYQAARRFRRLYCDDPGPEPPPPPFTGGQCPVRYQLNVTGPGPAGAANGVCLGGTITATNGNIFWGPILGIRLGNSFVCSGSGGTAYVGCEVLCHGHAPVPASPRSAEPFWVTGVMNSTWYSVSVASVSRLDGLPDNCGSLPPVFPPPSIPPVDVDIEIAPNVFAPFTFVFAPVQIDVNGSITVPVNISGTADIDLNLNGKLVLAPNFEFQLDPSDFYPDSEPIPDPGGGGQGDESEPPSPGDPEGRIYAVSVLCRIDPDSPVSSIYQEIGPDIYAPRLGSVRFGTLLDGIVFWTEDIDVKGLNQIVECPIPWGSSFVVFNAAKGVIGTYTPIKSAPREWPPYLELWPSSTSDNR